MLCACPSVRPTRCPADRALALPTGTGTRVSPGRQEDEHAPRAASARSLRCDRLNQAGVIDLDAADPLVQEAPIAAFGKDLLRVGFDEAEFVQAQRVKADGVLGVVFAPFVVGVLV